MKKSLATVIIPVYNGELFLDETIQSVLGQHYRPIEIIVVDDGSSDGTKKITECYNQVKYIYQVNQGQTTAMNTGLLEAKGEYISFLDADDLLVPEKLSQHIEFLEEHHNVDIIMSSMKNFKDPSFDYNESLNFEIDESESQVLATATIRRLVFEKIGNFDTYYIHAKELDWIFRAKENGVIIEIDQSVVLLRRLHDSNISYNTQAKTAEFINVVRASIIRKKRRLSSEKGNTA